MHRQILTIARFTVLEAIRTRLLLLAVAILALSWAAGMFVHQIALTESGRLQSSLFAAGARLGSVFLLALYVTSSMVREFNEKGLELLLSLDLPRSSYVLGKLAGFVVVGAMLSLGALLPVAALTAPDVAVVWGLSLFLELTIVCAASLFCIVTFSQVMPALTFVAAFYLLGRSIGAMHLMSQSDLLGRMGGTRPALDWSVDMLYYLVPPLDRFAVTEWIASARVDADVLGPLVLQTAIYTVLLLAATLFDFYRREL